MPANGLLRNSSRLLLALALSASAYAATDISTVPLNTYSAPSTTDVKPNVLFVLDDSGSMDWNYMPDWANDNSPPQYLFRNNAFNGVAYNPAVRYAKPVSFNSDGTVNTTAYPNMTGASGATGADATTKPNWKAVKNDGYGIQSTGTSDLTDTAYSFTIVPGEYCNSASMRTCVTANAPTGNYTVPAYLRWCSDNALTNCRATYDATFNKRRAPSPRTATLIISGSSSTSVSGLTVGGVQIMAAAVGATSNTGTLAQNIAAQIDACTFHKTGACQAAGYSASSSGSVVTITAPDATGSTPQVTRGNSGTMVFTATAFAMGAVPGENLRTPITPGTNSYAFPGKNVKALARTDCAGTTCTYVEEMSNYANWWAYYRTRMQMMKTGASNAFSTIDVAADITNNVSRFRLGYMSINNNTGSDFLNLAEFKTSHKFNWYNKLLNARPNDGTPLRAALSKAGHLYAGKLTGTDLNGVRVDEDPLQYSCQQNYAILSTDGFWNGGAGYKLDDAAVGNQDAALPRPLYDGGSATVQMRTSTLQEQTIPVYLQIQTSMLQTRTGSSTGNPLQRRDSNNGGSTYSNWYDVASCSADNNGNSRVQCRGGLERRDSGDFGVNFGSWYQVSSCTAVTSGRNQVQCQSPEFQRTSGNSGASWTPWYPIAVGSCDADSSGTNRTECRTGNWTNWTNTASCTTAPGVECQYAPWSTWTTTNSCDRAPQSAASPYTVGIAADCRNQPGTPGALVNASTCTVSDTKNCQYTGWTSWSSVSSCTDAPQSTAPSYTVGTARECRIQTSGGTSNTLADVAAYYYGTDLRSSVPGNDTGTCTGPIISPSTTPNDLCTNNVPSNGLDVATTQHMTTFTLGLGAQGQMVYSPTHATDSSGDFYDIKMGTTANSTAGICSWQTGGACNWPTPSSDSIANIDDLWHAAINGRGSYFSASEPESLSSGLTKTLQTIINTPRPGTAAAAASSNPNISSSDNYVFSSSYKSVEWYGELIRQQIDANSALTEPQWSAMRLLDCATTPWTAATTYAPGSNYANGGVCYTVTTAYSSGAAFGSTDTDNTAVVPGTPSTRTIYTKGASGLIPFQWGNLSATQQGYFTKPAVAGLSQFCATGGTCLTTTEQNNNTIATGGAAGEALVNFLRGDRSNEERYFRKRFHVLGDIVSSEARYVKTPLFRYADPGYSAYRTAQVNRAGMVYVGANDGMLHAFSAETGQEAWAYIPEAVLPQIHKLADKTYSANHQYFVDNSPDVGDICPSAPASACSGTQWKTILVGGLNRGGKSYYALDVTNPAAPALLWEFTNAELGYSYGNPKITKLKNGTWVVLLTSGYNNTDGSGRLYVLNAYTGALIRTIVTGAGSAASPSGLARISAHALEPMIDNTTVAVYGGDLLGNLWRFDINGDIGAAGHEAHLLATFRDASGNLQPITSKPLEATINGKTVVYVGTGRYLGTTDVSDSRLQSFYAVMDRRDTTTHSNPRATGSGFVAQSLSAGACPQGAAVTVCSAGQTVRTSSNNAVNWATASGFYVDFLNGGERASSDATLGLGTLLFTTITPRATSVSACGAEGPDNSASFVYALDYLTGGAVVGSNNVVGVSLGSGMVTRPILVAQSDGTVRALIRASAGGGGGIDLGGTLIRTPPIKPPSGGGTRRVSWRELVD